MKLRHLLLMALAGLSPQPAKAAPNDLTLYRLVDGGGRLDNSGFQEMSTELGLILTPSPMQPAETTGQSGIDIGVDITGHLNSFWLDYWSRAREGGGFIPTIQTVGIRGRKGIFLPIPLTSEIEMGAQWLLDSRLILVGAKWRVALNEGFRWIPDVAVSAGINRLIGSDDMYLTSVTTGIQVSKGFSLFGDVDLTPFLNYESIFLDVRSRLIDLNPSDSSDRDLDLFDDFGAVSCNTPDLNACLSDPFTHVTLNRYDRISLGLRMQVALVQISVGLDVDVLARRINTPYLPVMIHGGTRFGLLF